MSDFEKEPLIQAKDSLNQPVHGKVAYSITAAAIAVSAIMSGCKNNNVENKNEPENCSPTDRNSKLNDNQRRAVLYYTRSQLATNSKAENELFEAFRLVDQELLNHSPCMKEMEYLMKKIKEELKKREKQF